MVQTMVQTMLAALLGATLTAISVNAQTPTVVHDLFLPWADGDSAPTAASIVDADPSLTTYAVNFLCRGRWDAMCNYLNGLRSYTFTQGPTVYKDYISYGGVEVTGYCSLAGTTQAACTVSGGVDILDITSTDTYTRSGDSAGFHPVTITAGVEKLADATATATGTASETGSATMTGDDAESETETATETGTGIGSEDETETDSGNAAMPRMTGYANWVVGGGAVAVALAAM